MNTRSNSAYTELEGRAKRVAALGDGLSILMWDQEVMMPDGANAGRALQMATLAKLIHDLETEPEWAALLDAAEGEPLDEWQQANIRELRHQFAHATSLPSHLVEPMQHARAECAHTWRKARHANDWDAVEPKLEKLVEFAREAAKAKSDGLGLPLYDALLDEYDPGRASKQIDTLFGELARELPPLLEETVARQAAQPAIVHLDGDFSTERQRRLGEEVMRVLLFDFHQGRFDVSAHPFSGGATGDRRITTRYDESDFTKALMGTVHETGHAQYESGLPQDWAYQPVGRSRGMTLHESQSLLFEMQAGRSSEFIEFLAPLARAELAGEGDGWSTENLIRIYQRVERSLIRVDADEVTYPLHVMLRYRIEKALIEGDLEVSDLPAAWNAAMEDLIGIVPPSDTDGVMQDVHWYEGIFGYFPTYTLGAMTAAQIFAALKRDIPNVLEMIGRGDWTPLIGWLRENVHGQGCRFTPDGLIESATGAPLSAQPFLSHLRSRYLPEAA